MIFFFVCFIKAVHWAKAKRHLIKVLYTPLGQVIETASRFWIFGVDLSKQQFLTVQPNMYFKHLENFSLERLNAGRLLWYILMRGPLNSG